MNRFVRLLHFRHIVGGWRDCRGWLGHCDGKGAFSPRTQAQTGLFKRGLWRRSVKWRHLSAVWTDARIGVFSISYRTVLALIEPFLKTNLVLVAVSGGIGMFFVLGELLKSP